MAMYREESLRRLDRIDGLPATWHSLTRPLRSLWAGRQAERRIRRQIRELQQCDDRTLRDIGVFRCEIEAVVRGRIAARGESWR